MTDAVKQLREYLNDGPHDTYAPYEIADEALTALEAVLEVHQKTEHQRAYGFPKADQWEHYCAEDNQSWPCATVRAITDALKGAD